VVVACVRFGVRNPIRRHFISAAHIRSLPAAAAKMAVNTMDAIKKKMQAMKLEKENAFDKADQLEQKLNEQKTVFEQVPPTLYMGCSDATVVYAAMLEVYLAGVKMREIFTFLYRHYSWTVHVDCCVSPYTTASEDT